MKGNIGLFKSRSAHNFPLGSWAKSATKYILSAHYDVGTDFGWKPVIFKQIIFVTHQNTSGTVDQKL